MVREVILISSNKAEKMINVRKTGRPMNGCKINNGEP
jgi:hypothetical protein